jgi:uncharacterized membrane protein YfcA
MESIVFWMLPFVGLTGGFIAGLLGLGGGVVMLPLLTFVGGIPLKLATGTSLAQILVVSATGMVTHYRGGMVDLKAGLTLGAAGIAGGFAGSFLSVQLSTRSLQLIYLLVVSLAIILLFIPRKLEDKDYRKGDFNKPGGIATGMGVGCLTGLLGVGGGFIVIPLMIYVLKIPLRVAIGTSLLIILITSVGTLGAKFGVGHVNPFITVIVLSGSVIGALLGARISLRSPVTVLRLILLSMLVLILITVGYKTFF